MSKMVQDRPIEEHQPNDRFVIRKRPLAKDTMNDRFWPKGDHRERLESTQIGRS